MLGDGIFREKKSHLRTAAELCAMTWEGRVEKKRWNKKQQIAKRCHTEGDSCLCPPLFFCQRSCCFPSAPPKMMTQRVSRMASHRGGHGVRTPEDTSFSPVCHNVCLSICLSLLLLLSFSLSSCPPSIARALPVGAEHLNIHPHQLFISC